MKGTKGGNKSTTMKTILRPRTAVQRLKPYQPGKPIEETARELGLEDIIKMASNESPIGSSPRAVVAAQKALRNIHLYPDGAGFALKSKLSEKFGLDRSCFTLGNGSSDILTFVLWAFVEEGDQVLTAVPTFVMYPIWTAVAHGTLVEVPLKNWKFDLKAMAKKIGPRTRVIFLCNPNNPTGTIVTQPEFDAFMKHVPPRCVVVVDEAYVEFVEDPVFPDSLACVREGKNVVVLRTFSKIVGLAGLRIGYGISTPQIADWLNRVRPPFNTSTLAQAAAAAALDDEEHIARTKRIVRKGREYLRTQCEAMGLFCVPSWTNFMVVHLMGKDRAGAPWTGEGVFKALLKKGVIVRSLNAYGLKDCIRVSVGTDDQNRRFVEELKRIVSTEKKTREPS